MQQKSQSFTLSTVSTVLIACLCLAGLAFAIALARLHHQVHTNPSFQSFCAMSDSFNCETVAESQYSVVLGVPVAGWGVIGYLFMLSLLIVCYRKKSETSFIILALCCCAAVLVSLFLALISYCVICSFCLYCSITYGINLILLIVVALEWWKHKIPLKKAFSAPFSFLGQESSLSAIFIVITTLMIVGFPNYWNKKHSAEIGTYGYTAQGLPWIGVEDGKMVVEEFSDYMCSHCKRGHQNLRTVIKDNPDTITLIHRHFPLDRACNPLVKGSFHDGACEMAKAAICAGKQSHFWEMNDLLYDFNVYDGTVQERIEKIATSLKLNVKSLKHCMESKESEAELKKDIDAGIALQIQGTPVFVVDNNIHIGQISQETLDKYGVVNKPAK